MGAGSFTSRDWEATREKMRGKTAAELTAARVDKEFNSVGLRVRESRDLPDTQATPVIFGQDGTGSMNNIIKRLMSEEVGKMMLALLDKKPVTDPQLCFAMVGDVCDRHPLQMGQFEADGRIVDQLTRFYIEGGGGSYGQEDYPLVWYAALNYTSCDAWEKRQQKGFLFTLGDEAPHTTLFADDLSRIFGVKVEQDVDVSALLAKVSERWHVFHINVNKVARQSRKDNSPILRTAGHKSDVQRAWEKLLGQNAIELYDLSRLGEIVCSIIQMVAGESIDKVADGWSDAGTALVVRDTLGSLTTASESTGIVRF